MNISVKNNAQSFEAIKPADINTASAQYDVKAKENTKVENKDDKLNKDDVALEAVSSQGDDLKVSKEGMQNSNVFATVKSQNEDGTVAQKDPIKIEEDSKAAQIIKEQIKETKENQEKAMVQVKETAQKQTERMDEKTEGLLAKSDLTSDEEKNDITQGISNLSALTKQQVEELYRAGKISRYDYEKNMSQREEQEEKSDALSDNTKAVTQSVTSVEPKETQNKALVDSVDSKTDQYMSAAVEFSQVMH